MISAVLSTLRIQQQELKALSDTFCYLDKDQDGFLSASELRDSLFATFNDQIMQSDSNLNQIDP